MKINQDFQMLEREGTLKDKLLLKVVIWQDSKTLQHVVIQKLGNLKCMTNNHDFIKLSIYIFIKKN
jgi:hypothetical protein